MKDDILSRIQENAAQFSKGQRQISNYILAHYEKAAFMTASVLGRAVGVSESTVVRFASQIGFDGYPDLQRALQEMIRSRLTSVQRIEVMEDQIGSGHVLDRVLNIDIDKIRRTAEETSHEDFDRAADAIASARTIYIIGAGSASPLAQFLSFYLRPIFDNVKLIDSKSASGIFEQLMYFGPDDVLIGISFPRYSRSTAKAFQYASNIGEVVAITDSRSSPLAANADYLLLARSDMISFIDSLVAPLSLINALIVALSMKKKEELLENFRKLENIWDEYDVYAKLYGTNEG